jgi:hypothetical protein
MDLTEQQVREIRKWAQRAAPYVETVHLYGSRVPLETSRPRVTLSLPTRSGDDLVTGATTTFPMEGGVL